MKKFGYLVVFESARQEDALALEKLILSNGKKLRVHITDRNVNVQFGPISHADMRMSLSLSNRDLAIDTDEARKRAIEFADALSEYDPKVYVYVCLGTDWGMVKASIDPM